MFIENRLFMNFYKYKRKLSLQVLSMVQNQRKSLHTAKQCSDEQAPQLKVLFFGTDKFSLPSLKALHNYSNAASSRLGAVTSFKSPANCVRLYAEQHGLPIYRWPISGEECHNYDLGVVVSFGHLIPENIINTFRLGMINVHASLLPRWRGAAPIIYALMHGDACTGVSIMKLEPKHFDIGDILAQREIPIQENILMPSLHDKLADEGADLLIKVIENFPKSLHNAKKQDCNGVTYAPKITNDIAEVNWSVMNAQQLYNRYRALYGFKNVNTKFQKKIIQLIEVRLPATITEDKSTIKQASPGSFVYNREKKCLSVQCAHNTFIDIYRLRIEGKKVMSAMDFNNGFLKNCKINCFEN